MIWNNGKADQVKNPLNEFKEDLVGFLINDEERGMSQKLKESELKYEKELANLRKAVKKAEKEAS